MNAEIVSNMRRALAAIPNNDTSFDAYVQIFGVLKWLALYGGWPDFACFKLWDEWAAKNPHMYKEAVQIEQWQNQSVSVDFMLTEDGPEKLNRVCHNSLCWEIGRETTKSALVHPRGPHEHLFSVAKGPNRDESRGS